MDFKRFAVVADLVVIWWLWRKILSGREVEERHPLAGWRRHLAYALTWAVIWFSVQVATFPGEWQDRLFHKADPFAPRTFSFSNSLVLTNLNLYEGLNIDDPEKAKWRDFVFRARYRDLRGADFSYAILPKVDFEGAHLEGAFLIMTHLEGASFQ